MFLAFCIGLLSVAGMCGGLYLHLLETNDTNVELCSIYMIVQGLVTTILCIVYNFIKMWDKDETKAETPKQDNLDNLEEVPVEEVN